MWCESPFIPTDIVSSPVLELDVLEEDEYYSIVPTTYDAKKIGPFFLTVSSTEDFIFKKIR